MTNRFIIQTVLAPHGVHLTMWQMMQKTAVLATLLILVSAPLGAMADPGHDHGSDPAAEGEPYHTTEHFIGFFSCGASYGPVASKDQCGATLRDPNAKSDFELAMDSGLTGLVVTLQADRMHFGTHGSLLMRWNNPPALGAHQYHVAGVPPVTKMFDLSNETWQETQLPTTAEAPAAFNVRLENSPIGETPNIAYQYAFEVHLGLFYNGEPIPEGYDPAEDTESGDEGGDEGGEEPAEPVPPHNETLAFEGMIECAAAHLVIQSRDRCAFEHDYPDAKNVVRFDVEDGLTGIALYLDSHGDALGGRPPVDIEWQYPPQLAAPEYALHGVPAIYRTIDLSEEGWTDFVFPTTPDLPAYFEVRLDPSDLTETPHVTYQYPFSVCLGLFYGGDPIPEDFVETRCAPDT